MIISVAKNIGFATSATRFAIPASSNGSFGVSSRFFKMVSIITIVPSTIIPKSIAPSDNRLAGILVSHIKIKAISNEIGIVIVASNAPLGLPRKIISTPITSNIP